MLAALIAAWAGVALAQPAEARDPRVVREFQRVTICPSTGRTGRCPTHIVDHIIPLCAGGADAQSNLQYQTRADSLIKDRLERAQCRALRRRP